MPAPPPVPPLPLVDVHVHVGGVGACGSGISVSPRFRRGFVFRNLLGQLGVRRGDMERADALYLERLVAHVREARTVDAVVALALDGGTRSGPTRWTSSTASSRTAPCS